jgi:hypothetical protein
VAKKRSAKPARTSKKPKKAAKKAAKKTVKKTVKKATRKTVRKAAPKAPKKVAAARPVPPVTPTIAPEPPATGISRGGPTAMPPTTRGAAPRVVVVVETSNNGPIDIRAITINQRMVVTNVSTSDPRTEFDITSRFQPSASIGWEIFAGIQFPRAGVFLERTGLPTLTLGQQAPLKKGVAWLDEKAVES